jgi:hypothetical protein
VQVRSAKLGESQSLTALCVRSKAHWGYDAAFMKLSAVTLAVGEDAIAAGRVLVAVAADGRVIGMACVLPEGETADLNALFVDPPCHRQRCLAACCSTHRSALPARSARDG